MYHLVRVDSSLEKIYGDILEYMFKEDLSKSFIIPCERPLWIIVLLYVMKYILKGVKYFIKNLFKVHIISVLSVNHSIDFCYVSLPLFYHMHKRLKIYKATRQTINSFMRSLK